MKFTKSIAAIAASLAVAAPAFAHEGDHSAYIMANIAHWLSSPSHSLFAVIGGIVMAGLIIKFARRNKA